MYSSCKRSIRRNTTWSAIYAISLQRNIPKFDTVLLHSNWSNLRRKYLSKIPTDVNALSCGPKTWKISGISDRPIQTPRDISKNPRSMYARVPQVTAQFLLKIELLSHIMGTTPILEMARAYGLPPRLWLLLKLKTEGRTIYRKPHRKVTWNQNSTFLWVSLIGLWTNRPRSCVFRLA